MKQKTCLGNCYALTKHKRKQTTIRYLSLLAVLTSMCLYAVKQVSAQQAEPAATAVADIKPLQIGDTIPEDLWHLPLSVVNHPGGKDTITLNDYRNKKLIILDFWASYCKPCVESLRKMDTLVGQFEQIAFLPVHVYENTERALPFLQKSKSRLSSVVSDTLLNKIAFSKHLGGFGTVWIKDGCMMAVPFSDLYLDSVYLTSLLTDAPRPKMLSLKNELIDFRKPFFRAGNGTATFVERVSEHARVAGSIPFRSRRDIRCSTVADSTIRYGWNLTLSELITSAWPSVSRVDWKIADTLMHRVFRPASSENNLSLQAALDHQKWLLENTYGYELRFPGILSMGQTEELMQSDLISFFYHHLGLVIRIMRNSEGQSGTVLLITDKS